MAAVLVASDDDQRSVSPPVEAPAGPELAADELVTYYQPFYNLRDGRRQGLEALVRHVNAQDGHAETPAAFFAQAKASCRMCEIDRWVLRDAIAQMSAWRADPERRDLILSVNLSADFVARTGAVADLVGLLTTHALPADRLLVDITVDTFRSLASGARRDLGGPLHDLQAHEVAFCLDGFTLADIDLLPAALAAHVDIVKVHPGQLGVNDADRRLLVSQLASAIQGAGLPSVAAGVESREQLRLVSDLGFEWAQGFFLGEPRAADKALSTRPPRLPMG